MVNLIKLKSLMGANDHSKSFMAKYLEISTTAFNNKLSGKVEFKASELKKIAELYSLKIDELYFF